MVGKQRLTCDAHYSEFLALASRTPKKVIDHRRLVIAVLASNPEDGNWPHVHQDAAQVLASRQPLFDIPRGQLKHRRGAYTALSTGVSHRSGQTAPSFSENKAVNSDIIWEFNGVKSLQRLAGLHQ